MLLRRLPNPFPPARHEIPISYIHRLASHHHLDPDHLWLSVTEPVAEGKRKRVIVAEQLAALTGRSTHALAGAIPELRKPAPNWAVFRHQPQTGCHRCDATRPGGTVMRLLPHHHYVCLKHHTWIGPPDADQDAADLDLLPDIVHAQYRHLRLLNRYGWAATFDAILTAFYFCGHIWNNDHISNELYHIREIWDDRVQTLIPTSHHASAYSTSRLFAAVYPEAIELAFLIASPYWRQAARIPSARRYFLTEVAKRVTYPYRDDQETYDPFVEWAVSDSMRPPAKPIGTYTPGRATSKNPTLHGNRIRRHENSKHWFSRSQDHPGRTLLFHTHLKPVRNRHLTAGIDEGTHVEFEFADAINDVSVVQCQIDAEHQKRVH